jgi:hypothetical protein
MIANQSVKFPPSPTDGEVTTATTTAKGLSTMQAHNIDRRLYALVCVAGWTGAPGTTSPEDGKTAVRSGSPP